MGNGAGPDSLLLVRFPLLPAYVTRSCYLRSASSPCCTSSVSSLMRRSRPTNRDLFKAIACIVLLVSGALALTFFLRSRHYLDDAFYSNPRAFDDSVRAHREAEKARRHAEYEARRAEWAAEKGVRQARHQAWLDSQAVWAARRARWAEEKAERARIRAQRQAHYDSLRAQWPEKFAEGTVVDANAADTATLKRIPGIGSSLARSIVRYREKLGGFVHVQQIEEVNGVPSGASRWFKVDEQAVEQVRPKLDLNRDDFRTLVHHPYLSYEQVRDIVNYRRHHPILSMRTLAALPSFAAADLCRLEPYVSF